MKNNDLGEKKKNVALVFGITSNYLFALANTLVGLKKHNKKFWDEIIVMADGITEEEQEDINKILECTFVPTSSLDFVEKMAPSETISKYSKAAFYRFECFNLLKRFKTVIWNDVDILIQGDISGLLDYGDDSGFALTLTTAGFKNEANFTRLIPEYNMFCPLYNSGMLVLKDNLPNYEVMTDWCISATEKYASILRWPDQGILNILIQEFNIKPEIIDIEKYCCHPSLDDKIADAAIIHAYGDAKFWSDGALNDKFPEWNENDAYWKKICSEHGKKIDEKESPLVSCVMSTYNRYDYLKDSVLSILNQTYKNFELIVVLEKCENQEKIATILESFNDKRIKIIKNKTKLGFPASLNVGIDNSNGKYIARMDDDDISLPNRFLEQVKYMELHPEVGVCGTNAEFFGVHFGPIGVETDKDKLKIITLFRTPFIHPTVMMNKELLDKYNLRYDPNYFTEDYEFWSRAVEHLTFANIDQILLKYRTGSDNLTNGSNEEKIHSSHKRIMRNQLEKYLSLNLTESEIELIQGRIDVLANCYNREEAVKMRAAVYKKIEEKNAVVKFYDPKKLNEVFKLSPYSNTFVKQAFWKKAIKAMGRPIYSRLMYRVDRLIDIHDDVMREYIEKRIKELEKKQSDEN